MRGISDTEVIGYVCEGGYTCALHSPEPSQGELDDSYVTAVFAGDERADEYHCRACYAEQRKGPVYLAPSRVTAVKETPEPRNYSRTGYGSKLPTCWMLQLDGKRWHRVYVVCFGNSGSAYVLSHGESHYLGTYDPRQALVLQGQSELAADHALHLDRQIAARR
jgi:hypothetical protein